MSKRILIFGLPGSGKTWLAERLQKELGCAYYNADKIRESANDWDFSDAGRRRQFERMYQLSVVEARSNRTVIVDFVCPYEELRQTFDADYTIWMDTIKGRQGRFEDTNKVFELPEGGSVDKVIVSHWPDYRIKELAEEIANLP